MADEGRKPGAGKPGGGKPGVQVDPSTSKVTAVPAPASPPADVPFVVAGDDDWESDLAAWDAAIPLVTRGGIAAAPASPSVAGTLEGVVPDDENAFFETPTTVVSATDMLDLDDLPEVIPAGDFDEGEAPASGSYAALVTTDNSAPSIFESDPPDELPPVFPSETLREMAAAPWGQDIGQLIALGDLGRPAAPERAYLETLARVIAEERPLARDKERTVALALAAARVADLLGDTKEATGHVEAALAADGSSPAVHRARLVQAERTGRIDDDAAAESLARLALMVHPDQAYYRSLQAEWILARAARGVVDGTAAAMITAAPEGLPRMLAEAELAWRQPPVAAAILETGAHRIGGTLGSALLVCAAGLNEVAGDYESAAEQRFVAARMDGEDASAAMGQIRDLARMEASAFLPALEDLLTRFPPSPLKVALARWGASVARRAGESERAWRFVADPARIVPVSASGPSSALSSPSVLDSMPAALARDRLDLVPEAQRGSPGTAGSTAEIDGMLGRVATTWSTPIARICLALRACELAVDSDGIAFALAAVEKTVAEVPDATVLAPAVEALAWNATLPATRLRGLRLWRSIDPARWTSASMDLAAALQPVADAPTPDDGTESTWAVLNQIAARDPTSPIFWRLAAMAARRGSFAEAAELIDRGIARPAWQEGSLRAPLAEIAAELMARADPSGAATRLGTPRVHAAPPPGERLTWGRVLRRLGDRDMWAAYLHAEAGSAPSPDTETDRQRRATLLLESVFWPTSDGDGDAVPALVSAVLDLVPLHPAALALALADRPDPGTLVERLVAGATAPGGAHWTLGASIAAAVSGDARHALSLATDAGRAVLVDGGGNRIVDPFLAAAVAAVVRRCAWAAPDPEQRGRIARNLASSETGAPAIVEAAEAEEVLGHKGEATRLFERALASTGAADVVADVQAGLGRLSTAPVPLGAASRGDAGVRGGVDGTDRLVLLEGAARAGRWNDVVARLLDAPPDDEKAGASILVLAAAIDEGRARGTRSREIWRRARAPQDSPRPVGPDPQGVPATVLEAGACLRIGDRKDADPIEVGDALEQLADVASRAKDERSAALLLVEAARLASGAGDAEVPAGLIAGEWPIEFEDIETSTGIDEIDMPVEIADADMPIEIADGDVPVGIADARVRVAIAAADAPVATVDGARPSGTSAVERRLRAAVRHDPTSVPAAMTWRRWLIRSGRIAEAAQASAAEAEALVDPTLRVRALLRAAAMLAPSAVVEISTSGTTLGEISGDWIGRASGYLRRALEIAPGDHEVFSRLRELYEEAGRHSDLVDLLASRLGATSNPFEVTALHLARAEVFAGPLRDRRGARFELDAILQKEPQHARALGRLAEIEQEDGNDARAAELLIQRAFIERSPEKLRELFLRLGRIYTHRVPDPKRALGAYSRVLQLDANNREALDELSTLYVGLGETKNAIAITERLVGIEIAPLRRAAYQIRLGHLYERAVDPRSALQNFRRAVDDAPRDIEALGELARYLEKTRDTAGRRALLDHAAADLRAAVLADPADKALIDTLVAVLRWRGRTASAAALAELGTLVAAARGDTGKDVRLPEWATPPSGGRRLAALAKSSVDEQSFPASVPPSVRQLFHLLGPTLWEGGKSDLSRLGVDRADRVPPGRPPRDIFDAVAGELAAGPFDMYVATARSEAVPAPLLVEPGRPPAIVLGASLLKLGPHGLRFAAGRTLRLVSTHLDMALVGDATDLGAWLGGVIRQFIGDYRHPDVPAEITAARAARVAKLIPKKLRQEVMPFAMESSGAIDLAALHAGIRDGANRIGLCASGSLGAALRVILTMSGAGTSVSPAAIKRNAEARALLAFALSDEYDDLVRSLE